MLGKMTIGKKLFMSIGAAVTAALIMGVLTFVSASRVSSGFDRVVNQDGKKRLLALTISLNLSEMVSLFRGLDIRAVMKDQPTVNKYHQDYRAEIDKLNRNLAALTPLATTPEDTELLQALTIASPRLAEFDEQDYQKASNNDIDGALAIYKNEFLPYANQLRAQSGRYTERQTESMAEEAKSAKSVETQAMWLTVGMLLVCMLVGVIVVLIVRKISREIRQTVIALNEGADEIAAAAGQVSSSSQSLAQGSSEQAASIEETSASSEEINSMARKNTDNSRATAELVSQSQQKVAQANQNLEDMVVAMNEITESSSKISKIIKVIDEIAFQTNILALNAAVEAARAGETGMGFAVVADEVRNLAQRSAQAAKDTAALIEDSIAKATEGKSRVDHVAVAMRAITEESGRIKILVDGVSQGSEEQSRGIEQIGQAITQIEKVTQTTAATAEESAAAAEELNAQSETLKEVIGRLRTMVGEDESAPKHLAGTAGVQRSKPATGFHRAPAVVYSGRSVKTFPIKSNAPGFVKKEQVSVKRESFPMEESFQEF